MMNYALRIDLNRMKVNENDPESKTVCLMGYHEFAVSLFETSLALYIQVISVIKSCALWPKLTGMIPRSLKPRESGAHTRSCASTVMNSGVSQYLKSFL